MISFVKHIGLIRRKGFLLLIMTLLVLLLSIFFVLSSSIQPKNQVDTQALEKRIRSLGELNTIESVSYTHLDVYKRQLLF